MAKRFLMAMLLLCLMMPAWAQSKPATVTIWGWRAQDVDVWKSVETALKAKGEQITIKYEVFPPTEYDSKLLVSLQGGVGPDLMYTRRLPGARTQALIDNSYLVPLDSSVDLSNFDNVSLSFIRSNNKTWGVPFANQIVGIFYNKAMFDKYKLKEPQTWDELVQVAETLQKNGITPFFVSGKEAWTLAMQNAMVGVSYPGDAWIGKLAEGKAKFTDPEYVNMLKDLNALKKYYQKDFMANTTAEQDVAFAMEQVAMVFYGVWGNTNWLKTNPDLKFDYFPVPPKDKNLPAKAYIYMDGAYGLSSASKNKDAAIKVLNYAGTKAYGELFSSTTGEITAIKGVTMPASKPILVKCYNKMVTIASTNRYWVGSPFDAGMPSVYNILQENMQKMYLDQMTPEELAKKLQDGISTWYPAFKK
ncbi:MAG: extracellular solute-binding protein [Spirochaetia bacterium]|jgi:ABC-type sugar transport system, periplasmic component|uniref:Extracellular solute-binding protein family 1 n=1 Tax=uncultured spirochete TaxID=156406 RepID=A0A3P3XK19_9SPIR|nr:extracellular solute-binding protein [Rectinema subterraneum]MDQ7796985.1 extracellular solute-binding protein [Spirochaetia bacterium]SLM14329.1 Extracellular solute-binding protein family 1 [uncultured spirochete]